ncbi:MAG: thioredoxin [Ginsengibacter sp.]
MKKTFCFLIGIVVYTACSPQANNTDPVYLRFPTIPNFTIYKAPDSTAFSRENLQKKKPVLFMVFSPDCEHCKLATEELLANIAGFKNTQIVMVTYLKYGEMIAFYKNYKIAEYPQVTMASDTKYFFPVFFKVKNLPAIFLYDKKGDFKKAFEGSIKIDDIIAGL